MFVPDLLEQDLTVRAGISQAWVRLGPGRLIVGVVPLIQLPDHHKIALIDDRRVLQHPLGVQLLLIAGLAAGVVAGGGNHV